MRWERGMERNGDYYQVLGVGKNATKEDIQKAYRKLARKYHPDMNSDKHAEETFKRINEAHSTLIDPESRKLYDQYGPQWQEAQHQNYHHGYHTDAKQEANNWQKYSSVYDYEEYTNPFDDSDYQDIFSKIFSSKEETGSNYNRFSQFRGSDIEAELEVSLEDIASCANKTISWISGGKDRGATQPEKQTLQVKLPLGLKEGSVIRLAGKGGRGAAKKRDGDLLLHIRIRPDSRFSVQDYDLLSVIYITPWEAALGGQVEVETLNSVIQLNIPQGISSGKKLRVGGQGLPRKKGGAGDLFVEIEIHVPRDLSAEERQLFQDLQKSSRFNPRDRVKQHPANVK